MLDILKDKVEEYKMEVDAMLAEIEKTKAKIDALTEVIEEIEEAAKEAEMCNDEPTDVVYESL